MRKRIIFERAGSAATSFAEGFVNSLTRELDVVEMRTKRGADFSRTQYYQIRVKPIEHGTPLNVILDSIENYLKDNSKKLEIERIQVNQRSFNSGKYSSVSFAYGETDFDIVVAAGANKGEKFEEDLLIKMDNMVAGIDSSDEAREAFMAIARVDSTFDISKVKSVNARSGKTSRSGNIPAEDVGKIIADIIVEMKDGSKRYISVKNRSGSTVAQFGLSKAFNDDLSINTDSVEWKTMLEPFGLDPKKIEEGLKAYSTGKDPKWSDTVELSIPLEKGSQAYKVIAQMWGANYIYLREQTKGFKAMNITKKFVDDVLLNGLHITKINYPGPKRKQINIFLENDLAKYKIEIRNPRGKGDIRPTQTQLSLQKHNF